MTGQLYLKYCHAELCTFQLKAKLHKADPVQVPSKLQPSKQDPLQESWNLGVGKKASSTPICPQHKISFVQEWNF